MIHATVGTHAFKDENVKYSLDNANSRTIPLGILTDLTEITFGDEVTAGAFMHPVLQCLDGS